MQPTLETLFDFLADAQENGAFLRFTDNRNNAPLQFESLVDALSVTRVDGSEGPFWLNWRAAYWVHDQAGRGLDHQSHPVETPSETGNFDEAMVRLAAVALHPVETAGED